MSHNEIWDDSALVDSWNDALEEYKVCQCCHVRRLDIDPSQHYHSLHARGETAEDAIANHEKESNSSVLDSISICFAGLNSLL